MEYRLITKGVDNYFTDRSFPELSTAKLHAGAEMAKPNVRHYSIFAGNDLVEERSKPFGK
jgi:hypothetical protein